MTAPVRTTDPITVKVSLGARSYDIVIGRGQLATFGERIVALRSRTLQRGLRSGLECILPRGSPPQDLLGTASPPRQRGDSPKT